MAGEQSDNKRSRKSHSDWKSLKNSLIFLKYSLLKKLRMWKNETFLVIFKHCGVLGKKIKMPFILRKWRQNRHHESLLIKSVDTQKKSSKTLSTHEKCPSWELAAKNPTELISVNYEVGPHRLGLERRLGCHIETINLTCHFPTWCLKITQKVSLE